MFLVCSYDVCRLRKNGCLVSTVINR